MDKSAERMIARAGYAEHIRKSLPLMRPALRFLRENVPDFENFLRQAVEIEPSLWMKWESGEFADEDVRAWVRTLIKLAKVHPKIVQQLPVKR